MSRNVSTLSMRYNNLSKKQKIISFVVGTIILIILLCLIWMGYNKHKYASKSYVTELIENMAEEYSVDADYGTISAAIEKDLSSALDNMDLTDLSDEQVKELMALVTGYLETQLDSLTEEQIRELATDIVSEQVAERLSSNETLMTELQTQTMAELQEKIKEYTELVNSSSTSSSTTIQQLAEELNMTESDLIALINDKTTSVDDKYATITNKANSSIEALATELNTTVSDLKKLIASGSTDLSDELSSLKTYTQTSVAALDESVNALDSSVTVIENNITAIQSGMIGYSYEETDDGRVSVTLTIPKQ